MEHTIRMPKLGLTMEEGDVIEWLVAAGEEVAAGQALVTIGTDKAETDIESPCAGRVVDILVEAGVVHPVGEPMCTVEEG